MSNYKDFSKTVDDNMNKILDDLTEIQTNVLSKGSLEDKINFLIALEMDRLRSDVLHSTCTQQSLLSQLQAYGSWSKKLFKGRRSTGNES